jgi:predicted DNA-binding transcriptional regulator AlpA
MKGKSTAMNILSIDTEKAKSDKPNKNLPALLKPADVARILNIGVRTMWRWVSSGKIPSPDFREGRIVRWRPQTIELWLQEKCGAD